MKKTLRLMAILVTLVGWKAIATAQISAKAPRIGFLGAASASTYASFVEAFRGGLRELGYVEGKNLAIEYRWADGKYDRLPDLAAELVRLKVDLIVIDPSSFARTR